MNFFYEEYDLSPITLAAKADDKAYAFNCFIDLFVFLGVKDRNIFTEVAQYFTCTAYPKNTLLFSDKIQSDRFYFIAKGATRVYQKNGNEEVTQLLLTEGNINTNIDSFINNSVTNAFLVTVEDCLMLELTYENLTKFQYASADFTLAYAKAMTIYTRFQQVFSNIMKAESKVKFDFLQQKMPQLINRFPLKHQASFLGMKPETISRIRNEIRFNKP